MPRKYKHSGITPLVQVDRQELGDCRLSPEEAVIKERESLLTLESKKKIVGQEELEHQERSAGARLSWTEFLRRLLRCNSELQVRDGSKDAIALYARKKAYEYTEADYGAAPPNGEFYRDHKYVSGFEKQDLPEYSHVILDSSMLPVREYRGWRSVLLTLMEHKALDYRKVIKEFHDPSSDSRSGRWMQQTQQYRT